MVVVSGSLWFVPTTVYLFVATLRAMYHEDRTLLAWLPDYGDYQRHTTMLVPWFL
jgi:protein-S-isoprenylcysteine O-methyltransferase Ste14